MTNNTKFGHKEWENVYSLESEKMWREEEVGGQACNVNNKYTIRRPGSPPSPGCHGLIQMFDLARCPLGPHYR